MANAGDLALPGSERMAVNVVSGSVLSLLVLVVVAHLGGWAVSLLGAPPLLGMLVAGLLLQNTPYVGSSLGEAAAYCRPPVPGNFYVYFWCPQ
jgi:hypothetical protein